MFLFGAPTHAHYIGLQQNLQARLSSTEVAKGAALDVGASPIAVNPSSGCRSAHAYLDAKCVKVPLDRWKWKDGKGCEEVPALSRSVRGGGAAS
jgi:hypothetical protein